MKVTGDLVTRIEGFDDHNKYQVVSVVENSPNVYTIKVKVIDNKKEEK